MFMAVGVYGIHENVSGEIFTPVMKVASLAVLAAVTYFVSRVSYPGKAEDPEIKE